jgi:hypothetical protein
LDDTYYQFVLSGRNNKPGMPSWIGEDRLIPLKAVAWMEMTQRVEQGEEIDLKKINKHLNDIVLLSALLQPGQVIDLPEKIWKFSDWVAPPGRSKGCRRPAAWA